MPSKPQGRPRSERAHQSILESTAAMLSIRGYEAMTIEAIATDAGVSKQTVYRWWSSKSALVAETALSGHLSLWPNSNARTGDPASDIQKWLHNHLQQLSDARTLSIIRALAAAAAESNTDAARLYEAFTGVSRRELLAVMDSGIQSGRFRVDIDIESIADALIGTVLYRALASNADAGIDTREVASGLVEVLLSGMSNPSTG